MQKQTVISTSVLEGKLLDVGGVGTGPTEEKLAIIFHTLDTILPQLGIYRQLVKLCRDELFDAVYSQELTAADTDEQRCVQRVPYFVLSKRLLTREDGKSDNLLKQVDALNSQLMTIQGRFDSAQESICELENAKLEELHNVEALNNKVQSELAKNESLQTDSNVLKRKMDEQCHLLNCDISRLQKELSEMSKIASQLTSYKTTYNDVSIALHRLNQPLTTDKPEHGQVASQNVLLTSDVDSCQLLEQQLLTAQNAIIEEYDKFLEDSRQVEFIFPIPGYQLTSYSKEHIGENESLEKSMIDEHFKASLDEIDRELALLRQHKALLHVHLQEIDNGLNSARMDLNSDITDTAQQDAGGDELSLNPFSPHERLFNKYAVMLYTSDSNAASFSEFSDALYCHSCAEKTVICPHKLLNQEHVFKLPSNVTHLKVARPRVRMPTSRNVPRSCGGGRQLEAVSALGPRPPTNDDDDDDGEEKLLDASVLVADFSGVWNDYETRTDLKRQVSRPLSLERTVSLLHQFVAYLLQQDVSEVSTFKPQSILDCLYEFMRHRFIELSVSYLATHDFLTALVHHSTDSKLMMLTTHIVANSFDACCLRYVLLLQDLIQLVDWTQIENFNHFAIIVYPFLNEDDLEAFQLDFISFGENKISSQLVTDYIITSILKHKEPRFLEMETVLECRCNKDVDAMSESEYISAADDVVSMSYDRLQQRLYRQTAICLKSQTLPLRHLAHMTSYLNLLGSMIQIKRDVRRKFCTQIIA